MNEKWIQWKPAGVSLGNYTIDSVVNKLNEGLKLILINELDNNKIEIEFGFVGAYRCTYESWATGLFVELDKQEIKDVYKTWSFFKVINSRYMQCLSEMSGTWSDEFKCEHFVIMIDDTILDVIATDAHVKFLEPEMKEGYE